MKKVLFVLSMLFMLTSFSSCTDKEEFVVEENNEVTISSEEDAFDELRAKMAEIGSSFGCENDEMQTRKGIWSILKAITTTIFADAVGALAGAGAGLPFGAIGSAVGAVTVGTTLSAIVASSQDRVSFLSRPRKVVPNYQQKKSMAMDSLIFADPLNATKLDSVGYYHNLLMFTMYESNPTILDSLENYQASMMDTVAYYHDMVCDSMVVAFENSVDSFIVIGNNLAQEFCLGYSIVDGHPVLPSGTTWNAYSNENSIIVDYIEDLSTKDDSFDIQQYTDRILSAVERSSLTDRSKLLVKCGILVCYSSIKLWKSGAIKEFHRI